jgi:chromodomain-helicase-DNA-binding protein 1
VEDEEDDNEEDGSYADDEYGKRKAPKKRKKKSQPSSSAPRPKGMYHDFVSGALELSLSTAISRNNDSDSDSDYGSRSKKKKRPRVSGEEIRISSRGGKIPNYTDDVQALAELSEEEVDQGYYVDPNAPFKEEDEIESVLSHCRDEGREDDPDDVWFDNVVSVGTTSGRSPLTRLLAFPHQVEKFLPSS